MNHLKHVFIVLLIALAQSCSFSDESTESLDNFDTDKLNKLDSLLSKETVREIIKAIPSPLELTSAIKSSGATYDQDILHDPQKSDDYSTNFQKAVNLGIYGADIAYINVYERTKSSTNFIESIKGISTNLRIGQFFDFEKMRSLAEDKNNIDSLINLTSASFEDMDNFLNDNNRGNISGLILAGGWIEAMHIAVSVFENLDSTKNEELKDRIGEQKIVLEDLLLLVSMYKNDPQFSKLIEKLEDLKKSFKNVTIDYIYEEPTEKEVDGALVIVDNSRSEVIIDDESMMKIIGSVKELRKFATQ
ncbi:MAG: hypothetical protein MRY83_08290 [Flavobacteriales bacterium]|nr:hypothetical protein [Flavobacteriales bacterium]